MTARRFIKAILPPVVVGLYRRFRPKRSVGPPEWEYLPGGWRDGSADAEGWNVESVVAAQREKWPRFVELVSGTGPIGVAHEAAVPDNQDYGAHATLMSFGYVAALASHQSQSLSILDWGGGTGHYGVLSRVLLPEVAIDYHCKDMPLLCAAGRELQPDATFHEEEGSCFSRSYDLVMASGSLHYSRDWRATFRSLAAASDGWLFITRLPMVRVVPSFVVVQRPYMHGYDTEYCGWFLNYSEVLDHASHLDLELVREFLVPESPNVENAPESCRYGGFLFKTPRRKALS